jgi:hypothetical protein
MWGFQFIRDRVGDRIEHMERPRTLPLRFLHRLAVAIRTPPPEVPAIHVQGMDPSLASYPVTFCVRWLACVALCCHIPYP